MQSGVQYPYTRRSIFKGLTAPGGSGNKGTGENVVLFFLRYLPFQQRRPVLNASDRSSDR